MHAQRPVWAEISLAQLQCNFAEIAQRVYRRAEICAVIKCDAYGHGAVRSARALADAGAAWFAVTGPQEGAELRAAGIRQRLLLLSGFYREEAEAVVHHHLTPNIWELEHIAYLSRAVPAGTRYPVHVEVDTGMSRQGVSAARLAEFLSALRAAGNLDLEGVYQHYASGECASAASPQQQDSAFSRALAACAAAGFLPQYIHMANSGATLAQSHIYSDSRFQLPNATHFARCGIALYGYCLPLENTRKTENWTTRPVLSWKTRIISLREVPAGTCIGYSGTYITSRSTRVASLAVGYGDGFNRLLSNRGRVLVRDSFAPIIGNISMDISLADVTAIPSIAIGDEVVLLGGQGTRRIDAWDHARICNTIPYEILCNISKRVPRLYLD